MSEFSRCNVRKSLPGVALAAFGMLAVSALPAPAQDAPGAATETAPSAAPPATDMPATCSKKDFETVVDQSAAALRELNSQNRPRFQERLRALRDKMAWNEDEFLKEAVPYVKDDQIDGFDKRTTELLSRIASMGDEGSASATPDCELYRVLRGHMNQLVETQQSKWTYMFRKIDEALSK